MEELIPIVRKLAHKYTSFESTSITYEKAQELMEAVIYCIREVELIEYTPIIPAEVMTAQQAYEAGLHCIEKKVKNSLNLYNQILSRFKSYENICLRDTFIKAIPEFFKWYDIQLAPQNTILTLDYPVLKDISVYTGIDKIYEFLLCVSLEQKFLNLFSEDYIISLLVKNNPCYEDMRENICEIVLLYITGHILADKPFLELDFTERDYIHIREIFFRSELKNINHQVKDTIKLFLKKYYENENELLEYFVNSVYDILLRIKAAADNEVLCHIL